MIVVLRNRFLQAASTLVFLIFATFFLLRLAPGEPFDGDHIWPAEIKANIDEKYGLNQPLYSQFYQWARDLARGDLRESFHYLGTPVKEIIEQSLPPSLELGALALLVSVTFGLALGILAAWKRGTLLDASAMFIAVSGMTLPAYLLATLLILYFSNHLGWLPPALWEDKLAMILPTFTLALRPLAMVARMTRTTLLETLHEDFIRTAHAKGLSETKIVFKHALKNSLVPIVTLLGPIAASLITGSYVVETIFQIPGMGQYFITSVIDRDYPLVMGITLVYGVILILCNLAVDLSYAWLDPRIRLDAEN